MDNLCTGCGYNKADACERELPDESLALLCGWCFEQVLAEWDDEHDQDPWPRNEEDV